MSAFTIPSIFTAVDKFSAPVRNMSRNLHVFSDRADAAISRNERMFRKLTPAIGETQKQMLSFASSAAVAGAIVGTAAFSAKAIVDYETELANLQAVTGTTGDDFIVFKGKIKDVANETKTSAVTVAQAFTAIANNQPELLKDADALAKVTKGSIILAQAAKMELKPAGEALTQILNQFGKGANEAAKTVDILAAGSVAGSSEIRDTADAIQKFGTVAANAGVKIDESVALIELASKFEKGSEAGQKLRNILITMSTAKVQDPKAVKDMQRLGVNMEIVANKALPLNTRLKEMAKVAKDDAALFHIFGKENQALATGVLSNADAYGRMVQDVNKAGVAAAMAEKNNATFARSWEQLKDKFVTWIVTSEESTKVLEILKKVLVFVADNLSTILKVVGGVIALFVTWKALIIASKIAMIAYNVVMGINAAITGQSAFATMGSTVAYGAFRASVIAGTAAQWAFNAAMLANPIGLVIVAVAALAAGIMFLKNQYDSLISGMDAAKKGGANAAINHMNAEAQMLMEKKKLTKDQAMSEALASEKRIALKRYEIAKLREIEEKNKMGIFGMSNLDNAKAAMHERLGAQAAIVALNQKDILTTGPSADATKPALNGKASEQASLIQQMQSTQNANVNINVKSPNGIAEASSDNSFVNINTTSTMQ